MSFIEIFWKFSAFSHKFHKFFSITRTILVTKYQWLILRLRKRKLAIKKKKIFSYCSVLVMAEANLSVSCIGLWLSSWRPLLGVVIWQKIHRVWRASPYYFRFRCAILSNSSNQSLTPVNLTRKKIEFLKTNFPLINKKKFRRPQGFHFQYT